MRNIVNNKGTKNKDFIYTIVLHNNLQSQCMIVNNTALM